MNGLYIAGAGNLDRYTDIPRVATDGLDDVVRAETQAFLIVEQANTERDIAALIQAIRQHPSPWVFLRPIVLIKPDGTTGQQRQIEQQCDAVIDEQSFFQRNELADSLVRINKFVDELPNIDASSSDSNLALKVLRLMVSRRQALTPVMTTFDKAGFTYSLLAPLFSGDGENLINVLAFLEQQNLIDGDFAYKTHSCSFCESSLLNFTENCTDCGSADLSRSELFHHFKCGHVAPAEQFNRKNKLACPKCDLPLRHIGVDYDKPSVIFKCNQCAVEQQDPTIKVQCFACWRIASVDDTEQKVIKSFGITALGQNAAIFGMDSLFTSILQSEVSLYSAKAFAAFERVERARIVRYKRSVSSIATIHFTNLETIYNVLGKRTAQLFKEVSAVFRSVFRESDVITARNESVFVVLLIETDKENAGRALERLTEALKNVIDGSLAEVSNVEIETTCDDLLAFADADSFVEASLRG